MSRIRVAVVGVGNCASSLVQGVYYYRDAFATDPDNVVGLAHPILGGYAPGDIDIVAAVDIDRRKVGKPLHEAIQALPNNTKTFYDDFTTDVTVQMGNVLDGVAAHMSEFPDRQSFRVADEPSATQADDREQLLARIEQFNDAIREGDVEKYADVCVDDFVFTWAPDGQIYAPETIFPNVVPTPDHDPIV